MVFVLLLDSIVNRYVFIDTILFVSLVFFLKKTF